MKYLPVVLVTIVAVELFLRLSVVSIANELLVVLNKVTKVIASPTISDHWKEKVLLRYAGMIALISFKIAVIFSVVSATVLLLSFLLDHVLSLQQPILEIIATWLGLAVAMAVSLAYVLARSRFVSE